MLHISISQVKTEEMDIADSGAELLAQLFRTLSHPFRLQLLRELRRDEECVCHLARLFKKPQPYVSQQLATLREAGLIADRRDGQRVFYSLRDERLIALLDWAKDGDTLEPSDSLESRGRLDGCPCPKCVGEC